jgi:transcriptional regulator with XRE-family HTH domain
MYAMQIHEKIRQKRQSRNWSQEDMAAKLGMSLNGYAKIERGETDAQISKLEEIARVFDMELMELLTFGERNIFYLSGNNNPNAQQTVIFSQEATASELQKCRLIIEHKDKEISYLKEIIELMKKDK